MTTTTGDLEGDMIERSPVPADRTRLARVLSRFRGEIEQTPPMYSALKRDGKPLYAYARAGIELERAARRVTIRSLEVIGAAGDDVVLEVTCSKGTYIRVLAEDIGKALGCGACLAGLQRTRVGRFALENAVGLEALESMAEADRMGRLMPVDALLADLPSLELDANQARRMESGQPVDCVEAVPDGLLRIYGPQAVFLGVAEAASKGRLEPRRLVAAKPRIG